MATLESIPLLFVFILFVAYGIGSFGVIHTGILHSIAARAYAFETFRHRPQLRYFRDTPTGAPPQYYTGGTRIHGIQSDAATDDRNDFILATERAIFRGISSNADLEKSRQEEIHINIDQAFSGDAFHGRYSQEGVNIVWIKVYYGICLDAACGD